MTDVISLACAHLDAEGDFPRERVAHDLRVIGGISPEAARSSLVLAAAELRMLEDAGEMAVLLQ